MDVIQRKRRAACGVFALALVIPAAGDLGFADFQAVLVERESGAERNVFAYGYIVNRIAAIGCRECAAIPIDLHRERRIGDDHAGNFAFIAFVEPFLRTLREIEIAAGVQKLVSRAACACDRPIASCAGTQRDILGRTGQRSDRAAVVRDLNLRRGVIGL